MTLDRKNQALLGNHRSARHFGFAVSIAGSLDRMGHLKKTFILIGIAAFFASCASYPQGNVMEANLEIPLREQWEAGRLIANSQDDSLVVIGLASRHVVRDDEIAAAKSDAAQKVAMFHGMSGSVESTMRTGVGIFGLYFNSQTSIRNVVDYEQFIDRLQFDPDRDVLVTDGGTLVRFRYGARVSRANFVGSINAEGRPNWLYGHYLPELDGYIAAVGVSQNQVWLRDTVMISAQATALRIIENMSTRLQSAYVYVSGYGLVTETLTVSEGQVSNFRVLEFWINPGNGHVYTLGIARFVE